MHLTVSPQALWTSLGGRGALPVSFWLSFYARQRQLSQQTLGAFVFGGLPVTLGDDPSAFFKTCSDPVDKDLYRQTQVGLLCIDEENPKMNPSKVGIINRHLASLPQAFCVLYGLIYALHLDYPKYMKNTFCFVQQVMFNLRKSELTPKIQTLKNQLAV